VKGVALGAAARVVLLAWIAQAPCHAEPRGAAAEGAQALAALRTATLTERALKLHAQVGQHVLEDRSRRALAASLRGFDAAVRAVGVPAGLGELHESAAILAILARQYHAWATRPPTRDNARALGDRAEEVAWEAAKVARLASVASPPPPLAAKAEEAAALAHRVARLVLWQRWGIAGASAANELALAKAGLQADLEALRAAAGMTPEIDAELRLAENQAAFLFAAASGSDPAQAGVRQGEYVAKASDNTAESLERLAARYAAAARGAR